MRNFINIIESTQGPLSIDGFTRWSENNYEEWLEDDVEAMGGIEVFIDKMNAWVSGLPSPLTLYRGLHVVDVDGWLQNPTQGSGGLGIFWTDEYEIAINENGPDGGFSRNGVEHRTNVIMTAQVTSHAVDWNATVAIRVVDSEEPEIRLLPGAEIYVSEVHVIDFDQDTRGTIGREHITRTIPVGRRFRA